MSPLEKVSRADLINITLVNTILLFDILSSGEKFVTLYLNSKH